MPIDAIEADLRDKAEGDVAGFASLTLAGKDIGNQILQELLSSRLGMKAVVGRVRYDPREIAAEIRNKNAHAVLWNPQKKRYFFASEMHREAAKTLWVSRETHTHCRQRVLKRKVRAFWCFP